MKKTSFCSAVLIAALLIYTGKSFSQATLSKPNVFTKLITDFGAVANDGIDDTWAFIKAGHFISNEWDINGVLLPIGQSNYFASNTRIRLEIPSGTYNVGKQIVRTNCASINTNYGIVFGLSAGPNYAPISLPFNSAKWHGLEVIKITNVDEVEIVGTGSSRPTIVYNSGLHIGYFDCIDGTPLTVTGGNLNNSDIGHFILATNSKNVSISNIIVDGNNIKTSTIYGGNFLDISQTPNVNNRIQLGADGIALTNTKAVTVTNVNMHHMTRDGIQVNDNLNTDPSGTNSTLFTKLLITDCNFDFNRRQGISWVGGRNLNVSNTTFNNIGQSVYSSSDPTANGSPGSGIDIEPNANVYCVDGVFSNCQFKNNTGKAVENEVSVRTKNILFNNNTICQDIDGDCVWVKGPGITFDQCFIWGTFIHGNSSGIIGNETKFTNCEFADEEYQGMYAVNRQLVNTTSARRLQFNSCTFRIIHPSMRIFFITNPSTAEADYTQFKDCIIKYESTSTQATADIVSSCIFDGANSFSNNNPVSLVEIKSKGLVFNGSTSVCQPNSFTLNGRILLGYALTNTGSSNGFTIGRNGIGTTNTDGNYNFNIAANSCVYFNSNSVISIGIKSSFRNQAGGQLVAVAGTINNNGKIILEPASHTCFQNSTLSIIGQSDLSSEFYYHKTANMGINPTWINYSGFSGYLPVALQNLNLSFTKFDGGNPLVTNSNLITTTNEGLQFPGWIPTPINNPNANNNYLQAAFPANPANFNWSTINPFSIEISFKLINGASIGTLFGQVNGLSVSFLAPLTPIPVSSPGSLPPQSTQLHISYMNPTLEDYIDVPLNILPTTDNSCHYLTITRSTTDLKLRVYLDGNPNPVYTADNPFPGYVLAPYNTVKIGHMLNGWVNQIRLWSKTLSTDEVCYNYKRKRFLNNSNTGLWTDWDMTESAGSSVLNGISTSVNATIIGNVTRVSQNTIGNCLNLFGSSNSFYNFRPAPPKNTISLSQPVLQKQLNIYPNPNNGEFQIGLIKAANKQSLFIYNAAGKLIHTKNFANQLTQTFNIKNAGTGIYIVKLINGNEILVGKITVSQ